MLFGQFAVDLAALFPESGRIRLGLIGLFLQRGVFDAQIVANTLRLIEFRAGLLLALLRSLMPLSRLFQHGLGLCDGGSAASLFFLEMAFRQRLAAVTAHFR